MGLGLPKNEGNGEFKDICKYDARAGRMFRVDREGGASTPVEITQGFSAIFDLPNIQVGWVKFAEGGAPNWAMVQIGQPLPARPSPDHRQGFRVDLKLAKSCGGDVRELASAAGCVITALDALYDQYALAPESKTGKLPVVAMTGALPIITGSGAKTSKNYQPTFVIRQWVDRPTDLNAGTNGTAPAAKQQAPASQVPPPVQQQAAQPAAADADEF